MSTHKCPIDGCSAQVPRSMLMCARHWRRVSRDNSRELYDAYKKQPQTMRHLRAMKACINEVQSLSKPDASQAKSKSPVSPSAAGSKDTTP